MRGSQPCGSDPRSRRGDALGFQHPRAVRPGRCVESRRPPAAVGSQAPHVALEVASRVSCGSVSTRARAHTLLAFWDPVLLATTVSWALWSSPSVVPFPRQRGPLQQGRHVPGSPRLCAPACGAQAGARPPAVQGVPSMLHWHGTWAHGLGSGAQVRSQADRAGQHRQPQALGDRPRLLPLLASGWEHVPCSAHTCGDFGRI